MILRKINALKNKKAEIRLLYDIAKYVLKYC